MNEKTSYLLGQIRRIEIHGKDTETVEISHSLSLRPPCLCGAFICRLAALAAACLCVTCFAELPVARLFTIFPPGGKVGTSVEVEVTGQDLDDLRALHLLNTNLAAKHLGGAKFSVNIPTNAMPGICDCRVIGRFGISNPRPFAIGDLPELRAGMTNTSPEKASALPINSTVNGQAIAEAMQFFKFKGKKGQRIVIDCEAENLDSRMAPSLTVLDEWGRELVRSRGNLVEFRPNSDSDYLLKLHDFLFRGGNEYPYRLTISTRPRIDYVLPPSAVPGTKAKITLYGRNLPNSTPAEGIKIDGNSLEQLTVEIDVPKEPQAEVASNRALLTPAAAFVRGFEYRLSGPDGVSNPILISLAATPVILEQEPNNQPAQAQKLTAPCEITGQLYPANDRDWFSFEAKKSEVYWIEIVSQRLGAQTDPFVLVQQVTRNAKGEEEVLDIQEIYDSESLAGNEFKTSSLDPIWRFSVKEDGNYRIEVRDQFRSVDPRNVYRLMIRKETPDFELAILPQPPAPPKKDSKEGIMVVPFLRRGQTIALKIVALRRDGFKGEIDLSAEDLPPSISASAARIAGTTNSTLLFLTAGEKAPVWSGSCRIVGRTSSNLVVREARAATAIWNSGDTSVEPLQIRMTRDFAFAVGEEPAPVIIAASETNAFEGCVAGKLKVPLHIARTGDFASAFKLKAIGVPGLETMKDLDIDAKATNATVQLDLQKVKPGDYELVFQTQAQGKYIKGSEKPKDVTINVYSTPIRLKVAPAPVAAKEK